MSQGITCKISNGIKTEKIAVKIGNRRHRLRVINLFIFTSNFLNTDLE